MLPQFIIFPRLLAYLAMTAVLAGCGTQGEKPAAPTFDTLSGFTATVATTQDNTPWWETALPESLLEQIRGLLQDNPAIRIAAQDVAIDRARLDESESQRWLDINGAASSRIQIEDGDRSDTHRAGIDARLPLDLFGRLELNRDAAVLDLAQSLADLEQERLQQVQAYLLATVEAAEARQLLQLLNEQIVTAQTLLRLTEFRFSQGLASSVDVLQQRQQLASLQQAPAVVALRLRSAQSSLDELRGSLPSSSPQAPQALPTLATEFAVARPAQLLDRRPDLIALRAAMLASDHRYESALRERLPDVSLSSSAFLRLASGDPSAIINAALEAGVSVFDSGRLDSRIAAQRARLERAGIEYLQSWLAAVRETDDLLNALNTNRETLRRSEHLTKVAEDLFEATRRRYERGISDYLPVLAAVRALQQQQRDHLALQAEQLRIIVRLHTAMGLPSVVNGKES